MAALTTCGGADPPQARSMAAMALFGFLAGPLMSVWACEDGRFMPPGLPFTATEHNGVALTDVCFNGAGPHHIFVIGDWGGVQEGEGAPYPADHRGKKFKQHQRDFVRGVDDVAQFKVANMMAVVAAEKNPDFILNVGDSFYWGGVRGHCGSPMLQNMTTEQWRHTFEEVYTGPGLSGKQWLGVLGNHDYGGYSFTAAWDQVIAYTWGRDQPYSQDRWMMPAQYWSVKVYYTDFDAEGLRADFSVDYYFVDSNVWDATYPSLDPMHNLCSLKHNNKHHVNASCEHTGPIDVWHCQEWFKSLWEKQKAWLEEVLPKSTADWQIVVTHFPPTWGQSDWQQLAGAYGIDLIITGHEHFQAVYYNESFNFLWPTAWIISGGGGGITSEYRPELNGEDDQYGFMDLTISKASIKIEAYSHGGQIRSTTVVHEGGRGDFQWTSTTTTTSIGKVHNDTTVSGKGHRMKTKSKHRNSTVPAVGKNGSIALTWSKKNAARGKSAAPAVGKNGSIALTWSKKNGTGGSSHLIPFFTKNGSATAQATSHRSTANRGGSYAAAVEAAQAASRHPLVHRKSANQSSGNSSAAATASQHAAAHGRSANQSGGNSSASATASQQTAAHGKSANQSSGNSSAAATASQHAAAHGTPAAKAASNEGHKNLRWHSNRTSATLHNDSRHSTVVGMSPAVHHDQEDDCQGACVLATGNFSCQDLVTWLAKNWYQRSERPCKAAYIEALHQCKSCYSCPLAKAGCKVQYFAGENDSSIWGRADFDSKNRLTGVSSSSAS